MLCNHGYRTHYFSLSAVALVAIVDWIIKILFRRTYICFVKTAERKCTKMLLLA